MRPGARWLVFIRPALLLVGAYASWISVTAVVGVVLAGPDRWERAVTREFAEIRGTEPGIALVITHLGDALTVSVVLAVASIAAAIGRCPAWSRFFAGSLIGAIGIHPVVKVMLERARPEISPAIEIGGFAFPSGHATAGAAMSTAVAIYVLSRVNGRARGWVIIGAVALASAIGISRMVLGVHWPTDVFAGWLVGASWVWFLARLGDRSAVTEGRPG